MNHNGNAHEIDFSAKVVFYRDKKRLSFGKIAEILSRPKPTVYDAYQTATKRRQTDSQTAANDVETTSHAQPENAIVAPDNPFMLVYERSTFVQFLHEFKDAFHPADLVFYGSVSIACFGVSQALPGIGVFVAALYLGAGMFAFHRLKMHGRGFDILLMAVIEIFVGFPAHLAWANEALWKNPTVLPVEITLAYGGQMWTGRGIETPFKIACYVAAVLIVFGAYGVLVSVLANRKRLATNGNP